MKTTTLPIAIAARQFAPAVALAGAALHRRRVWRALAPGSPMRRVVGGGPVRRRVWLGLLPLAGRCAVSWVAGRSSAGFGWVFCPWQADAPCRGWRAGPAAGLAGSCPWQPMRRVVGGGPVRPASCERWPGEPLAMPFPAKVSGLLWAGSRGRRRGKPAPRRKARWIAGITVGADGRARRDGILRVTDSDSPNLPPPGWSHSRRKLRSDYGPFGISAAF
jgi:hypothetical protein